MRINWSDEADYPGQFDLWQANCERSMRGRKGQAELKELRVALLALPEKRLIHELLQDEEGGVCAIGAYAKHRGVDLTNFDVDSNTDDAGIAGGMPPLVAWKVVEMNDLQFDHITPEQRYDKMLAWVESKIAQE